MLYSLNYVHRDCPNRCSTSSGGIHAIGKVLMKLYNELNIKCKYYDDCQTILKVADLESHEKICNVPKCANYDICGNRAKSVNFFILTRNFCLLCTLAKKIYYGFICY